MATLVFEDMLETDTFPVSVLPGVTSANACASLLGSPLSHDFATISLSDLLCPWSWIEERAKHAAEADFCLALYNVQSKQRPTGVYRILEIIAQYKSPSTICGVVRNAFRAEQSVTVLSLAELCEMKFDMLTTIVIGNRFTRKRRNWIYTPRGYNSWAESEVPCEQRSQRESGQPLIDAPTSFSVGRMSQTGKKFLVESSDAELARPVWIFSGTADGNQLAEHIAAAVGRSVVSTATEYGAQIAALSCPGSKVVFGSLGAERREHLLRGSRAKAIVDATHPFAQMISVQLRDIAQALDIPVLRFERPSLDAVSMYNKVELCDNWDQALAVACKLGRRIFLSTGSNNLPRADNLPRGTDLFVRITPDPVSLQKALDSGISPSRIIAMQGPFSRELNIALLREKNIEVVLTKESGLAGGLEEKLLAAKALGLPVVVIRRPPSQAQIVSNTFEGVLAQLFKRLPGMIAEREKSGGTGPSPALTSSEVWCQ